MVIKVESRIRFLEPLLFYRVELKDVELFNKFREIENISDEERETIKLLIDAMIIKNKVEKAVKPEFRDPWENRMRKLLARFRDKAKVYSEENIEKIVDEVSTSPSINLTEYISFFLIHP